MVFLYQSITILERPWVLQYINVIYHCWLTTCVNTTAHNLPHTLVPMVTHKLLSQTLTMLRASQVLCLILTLGRIRASQILLITETEESQLTELFKENNQLDFTEYEVDHDEESDAQQNSSFCQQLSSGSFSAVVDLSWGGWYAAQQISAEKNIPYIRIEVRFQLFENLSK